MATEYEAAKAEAAGKLSRANAKLDRCRDRGNVRLADLEMVRNDLAELVEEHSAALDELEQLQARQVRIDGQVFISGWYAHAEACQALGWDAREAAWRKYREEMTATFAEVVPQQPDHNGTTCAFPGCVHPDHQVAPQKTSPEGRS